MSARAPNTYSPRLGRVSTLLLAIVTSALPGLSGEPTSVSLEVFASQSEVAAYPIEIGMPFPPGKLKDAARLRLLDPDGAEVPCQVEELGRYPDASLRAVLLVFISPISKDKPRQYTLEFGAGVARKAAPGTPVKVSGNGPVSIDTGALQLRVGAGGALLSAATAGDKQVLPGEIVQFIQEAGQTNQLAATQAEVKLEEGGPVRAAVLLRGRFGSAGDAHGYEVRVHAYAGTSLIRVQQTVLGLDGKKALELPGWGLLIPAGGKNVQCGLDGAARQFDPAKEGGLFQDAAFRWTWGSLSADELAKRGGRAALRGDEAPGWHYRMLCSLDKGEAAPGKADGWLRAETAGGAVGVCVRDFWQQYPKEFAVDGGEVTVWLHSPRGAPFMAKAGTAKTHELLFDFAAGSAEQVQATNAAFQDWPLARLSPEWVCATGVFGPLLPRSDPFTDGYNSIADLFLEFIKQTAGTIVNRACWYKYGNSDFGDFHTTTPWNVPHGVSREFIIEFLRGGDREWARLGARAARHYGDIDVCHAKTDENDIGRSWDAGASRYSYKYRHSPAMWAGSTHGFMAEVLQAKGEKRTELEEKIKAEEDDFAAAAAPRDVHQCRPGPAAGGSVHWCHHTGGAMPYFLLSSDRRALQVLREQADWMLRTKDTDKALKAWPTFVLVSLLDAHEATGDARYLQGAAAVLKGLGFKKTGVALNGEDGCILSSRRAVSLYRFWELNTPDASTGVDNSEIRRAFAEASAASMQQQALGCTPAYITAWAIACDTGLWPEETRAIFEKKVLGIISVDRKAKLPPAFKYRIPFLEYRWNNAKKTGQFLAFQPLRLADEGYLFNRHLYNFSCDYAEGGVMYAMPSYPHFVAVWKKYHQEYLQPRLDAQGELDCTSGAASPSR